STVQVWPWQSGGRPTTVSSGEDAYRAAFSPDGREVVTGHRDGTVRVRAWRTKQPPVVLPRVEEEIVTAVTFSPDGSLVVTAGDDKTARVFTVPDGRQVAELRGHSDELEDARFSPDGKLVATASADGTAALWTGHTGEVPVVLRGHAGSVFTVAFSHDSR